MGHYYTDEEIEYLRQVSPGKSNLEITKMFNAKFNLDIGEGAICATRKRYGIKNGYRVNDGQFKKGAKPWNKDIKTGIIPPNAWKSGHEFNNRPIGSERICSRDGYTQIKTAKPNAWEHKHRYIWEQHNGPIPDGHVVIFGDGNMSNFDINNLILVSRAQLLELNRDRLIQNDADLTRTAVMIVDLNQKIRERGAK